MKTVYCKTIIKERNCEGSTCEFFIRAYREKEISLAFGGTDEFLPLFGKDGGRAVDERRKGGTRGGGGV